MCCFHVGMRSAFSICVNSGSDESMSRRLIVNADDFGRSAGINRGILAAHDHGIVTSASAMVRWPAVEEAARQAALRPRLSVGLHVDLGEWKLVGNQWVAVYEVVSSENESAVAAEVERQLACFRDFFGHDPTHVDSHQHIHRNDSVRPILLSIASRQRIPLRHFSPKIQYCGKFYGQDVDGVPISGALSVPGLSRILENLPVGCTELACHPADSCDLDTMYGQERLLERSVLCDPRLADLLLQLQIELCSFGDIGPHDREVVVA
jgi:chitin disaccharide deacetylase